MPQPVVCRDENSSKHLNQLIIPYAEVLPLHHPTKKVEVGMGFEPMLSASYLLVFDLESITLYEILTYKFELDLINNFASATGLLPIRLGRLDSNQRL
jgi:hypothetical protein